MPAVFAHDTFGKIVYKELEGEIYRLVQRYQKYFRIGLQGPDVLFFYRPFYSNPVNETGHRIHEEIAEGFFEHAREVVSVHGKDSPHCAYILGVICHFMLDSECHGCVEETVRKTGISHNEIETEFERYLMLRAGKVPKKVRLENRIPTDEEVATVMSEFYEGVTPDQMRRSLRFMQQVKYLLHVESRRKERRLVRLLKQADREGKLEGILMRLTANEACRPVSSRLFTLFKAAVHPTVTMIYKYYQVLDNEEPLSVRFGRNFC